MSPPTGIPSKRLSRPLIHNINKRHFFKPREVTPWLQLLTGYYMRYFRETSQQLTEIPLGGLGGSLSIGPALPGSTGFSHEILDGRILWQLSKALLRHPEIWALSWPTFIRHHREEVQGTAHQLKTSSVSVAGHESPQSGSWEPIICLTETSLAPKNQSGSICRW